MSLSTEETWERTQPYSLTKLTKRSGFRKLQVSKMSLFTVVPVVEKRYKLDIMLTLVGIWALFYAHVYLLEA